MKTTSKNYAAAPLLVILYVAGAAILSLFGYHYGSTWWAKHQVKAAEKNVATSTQSAVTAGAEAQATAEKERNAQIEAGRGIQRASAQGQVAAGQLPPSPQRDFIQRSFFQIDAIASPLWGDPAAAEIAHWRGVAEAALAGQAAAQKEVAAQLGENKTITDNFFAEHAARVAADAKAAAALTAASRASSELTAAQATADEKTGLLAEIEWWGGWLVAVAVLAAIFKGLAMASPAGSLAANIFDLASKTAHACISPMLVVSEHALQKGYRGLTAGLGRFLANARAKLAPAVHENVTTLLDSELSPEHQAAISQTFHAAVAEIPVQEAKAKAALAQLATVFTPAAAAAASTAP